MNIDLNKIVYTLRTDSENQPIPFNKDGKEALDLGSALVQAIHAQVRAESGTEQQLYDLAIRILGGSGEMEFSVEEIVLLQKRTRACYDGPVLQIQICDLLEGKEEI